MKKRQLDINTPKGQETLKQERDAIRAFCSQHKSLGWISTMKDEPATVDGLFYLQRDSTLYSVVEVKCRNMTKEKLSGDYKWEWLISADKVKRAKRLAECLSASFVGFLHLVPDKLLLVKQVTNRKGEWVDGEPRYEVTTTQATVNGGIAERENAFINMEQAREYKIQ